MKKILPIIVTMLAIAANTVAQTTVFNSQYSKMLFWETKEYYRIPAILNQNGKLWAFTDDRTNANGDIGTGKIKIIAKTSTDNGGTWSSSTTIANYKSNATSGFDYAHGDAAVVCDRGNSNNMLMMCASGSIGYPSSTASAPIRVGKYISTDGGSNWTGTDVTNDIYGIWSSSTTNSIEKLFFSSGRICQSAIINTGSYYRLYAALCSNVGSLVVYSDDFGETWNALGGVNALPVPNGDEAKIEELPNGNILISSRTRNHSGRYFNIYTYTNKEQAEGSWGTVTTASIGSTDDTNGEILLVPAMAKDSNKPMYVALQSVPTGSTRANVSIYWKPINSISDIDSPNDFASGWSQTPYQVSSTSSAYSTMTLDNSGNVAFIYEDTYLSYGACYDIKFQSLSLETITTNEYTYTTALDEASHRTAFLDGSTIQDPWEGKIVTLKAKVVKGNTTYNFYLHNEGLNLKTETTKPSLSDYSYYWVISKNPETGYYYLSSYKGDGYMGKGPGIDYSDNTTKPNIPVCTDDYTKAFEIVEFSKSGTVNSGKRAQTMTGYALKFFHGTDENGNKLYRWVAVSENGAINWFDHTALGETTDYTSTTYWATDFEINEVGEVDTPNTYGTWDSPTHFGFPVKLARSDDGKAVVKAEDYHYYATLKLPFAVTLPDEVTAYKITDPKNQINEEVGLKSLTLTDNILPYETPVLLRIEGGQGDSYPVSKTIYLQAAKHHDIQETGFEGSLGMKTFTSEEYNPNDNANFFILGKKNGRVAFYYLSNQVLAANKAYYEYKGTTSAKSLVFRFDDDNISTAISLPETIETSGDAVIFDLSGRRVAGTAKKGVYIRNGKKYIVK